MEKQLHLSNEIASFITAVSTVNGVDVLALPSYKRDTFQAGSLPTGPLANGHLGQLSLAQSPVTILFLSFPKKQ